LLVVHCDLGIQHQGLRPKRGHRLGELRKALGQVFGVPADEADALAVLVGEHAVAIYLFLVDPAFVMDRARYERREHELDEGK